MLSLLNNELEAGVCRPGTALSSMVYGGHISRQRFFRKIIFTKLLAAKEFVKIIRRMVWKNIIVNGKRNGRGARGEGRGANYS